MSRTDATPVPQAQALAEAVVEALAAGGMRDVVLAPGSRSAPMAYALLAAEQAGAIRLHVLVDERSAGFVALGLAVASERPVGVVVTSGSAVANLHPAVLEAAHQRVPLVAISCDRPAELVARGGSQTTEHLGIFGSGAGAAGGISRPRATVEVSDAADAGGAVGQLLGRLRGPVSGPAHLNLAFTEPLVPTLPPSVPTLVAPDPPPASWSSVIPNALEPGPVTIVVAGDQAPDLAQVAVHEGWPVLAEPSSGLRSAGAMSAPPALLDALGGEVERVVVLGRPTLSRQVTRLLARPDVEVVVVDPPAAQGTVPAARWLEVPGARHVDGLDRWEGEDAARGPQLEALKRWQGASRRIEEVLDAEVTAALDGGELSGPVVARVVSDVVAGEGGLLVAGASMAIRELDLAAVPGARVVANRGVAGIDGTVSTALGHALARSSGPVGGPGPVGGSGPVRVLLGDLTLQHDMGGLVRGRLERDVDLQLLVLADDGGSIFATLEHGRPDHAEAHERVFATPQRLDLAALAAAVGARHTLVADGPGLVAALGSPVAGIEIVEVRLRREGAATRRRALHELLVQAARALC